jgi:hypothetical protein
MEEVELRGIVKRFAQSGWDLIAQPAKEYLDGADCREELVEAVRQADEDAAPAAANTTRSTSSFSRLSKSSNGTAFSKLKSTEMRYFTRRAFFYFYF